MTVPKLRLFFSACALVVASLTIPALLWAQSEIWRQVPGPDGLSCLSLFSGPEELLVGQAIGSRLYVARSDGSLPQLVEYRGQALLGVSPDATIFSFTRTGQTLQRSSDRGRSWEALESPEFRTVTINPRGVLFGLREGGSIFRSSDHGRSWKGIRPNFHLLRNASHFHVDAYENLALVLNGQSLVFSARHTEEWTAPAGQPAERIMLAMMRENGDVVYTTAGAAWYCSRRSLKAVKVQAVQVQAAQSGQDISAMAAGTGNSIYAATSNSGQLLRLTHGTSPRWIELELNTPAQQVSAMTVNAAGELIVACSATNSLWRIDLKRGTVLPLHRGIRALPAQDIAAASDGSILLAHGHTISRSMDHHFNWEQFPRLDGLSGELFTVREDREAGLYAFSRDGVFLLRSSASHWTRLRSFDSEIQSMGRRNGKRIFITGRNEALLLTSSLEMFNPDDASLRIVNNVRGNAIARAYNDELIFCSAGGMQRSRDEGRSWTGFEARNVSPLDVVQFSSGDLIAAMNTGILLSSDAGLSWQQPQGASRSRVNSLLQVGDSCVLARSEFAIDITTNRGRSWQLCSPYFAPVSLQALRLIGGRVYILTSGQGMYRTSLTELLREFDCEPDPRIDIDIPPVLTPSSAFTLTPNPVADIAQMTVRLEDSSAVSLTIFAANGRVFTTKDYGELAPGTHILPLAFHALAQGHYFIRCRIGRDYEATCRMLVLR